MTTGIIARRPVAGKEVGVGVGHVQGRDAIEGFRKVGLDAGKALIHHDSAGGVRQDDRRQAVGDATSLDRGMHIAGDIYKLFGLIAQIR